jgi:hypothetical protein
MHASGMKNRKAYVQADSRGPPFCCISLKEAFPRQSWPIGTIVRIIDLWRIATETENIFVGFAYFDF